MRTVVGCLTGCLLLTASASAQWITVKLPRTPRTADGKPNLTAPAPRTADGKPDLELGSGTSLVRQGWTRTSLKPADVIKVEGFLARDGSRLVNAVSVSTGDGKKLFAGSSFEGAPKQ